MPTLLAEISMISDVLLVLAAIVLAVTIGRAMKRARRVGDSGEAGESEAMRAHIQRLHEAGDKILAQIDELGRDTVARAETRVRVLSELLARAEQIQPEAERVSDRLSEVYALAEQGLDAAAIAERTEFERGEVDLVLGLRTKAANARAHPEAGEDARS
jgi:uncharacterized protein YoxC